MRTITISEARRFSLNKVQSTDLLRTEKLHVQLLCFEAGQKGEEVRASGEYLYQVLEGEALVYQSSERLRLGKGKLLNMPENTSHRLENAGGGLLVVMATHAL